MLLPPVALVKSISPVVSVIVLSNKTIKLSSLLRQQLQQAKHHLRLQDEHVKLGKYSLLIINGVGYVRKTEQETSELFERIAHCYELRSMNTTLNKSFEQWDELFDDSTMTVAVIDRSVHHMTIIHCEG